MQISSKVIIAIAAFGIAGCNGSGVEEKRQQCRSFASQLPVPSSNDSAAQKKAISKAYDSFDASCNEFATVIPGS